MLHIFMKITLILIIYDSYKVNSNSFSKLNMKQITEYTNGYFHFHGVMFVFFAMQFF